VVVNPWGLTVPLSVADELVTFIGGLVVTTGGPVAPSVVKVRSTPYLVPAVLAATARKWYVVLAAKPLMVALMFW
jgi:hypothetical protein